MESFLIFWLLVIFLIITLTTGIIYLGYWIPKRLGNKKLGKWIAGTLTMCVFALILSVVFEDELFFKSDAKDLLAKHNIELKNNFKLNSNEFSGIMDFYHRFELTISESDKSIIVSKIKEAENYKYFYDQPTDIRIDKPRYSDDVNSMEFTSNYETENEYVYEYYKPNQRGHKPTYNKITIMKYKNKLIYENISD
jgi:hypothetical protein